MLGLGTLKSFPELHTNLGINFGYGEENTIQNKFISPISNQTGRKYSIAISYNYYIDNIGTSQGTGLIAMEFDGFGLIHENDMFGEPRSDKFRSAASQIYYRTENYKLATNIILWHGDSFDHRVFSYTETDYPARFGYKDLSTVAYGKYSHGILTAHISYVLPFEQIISIDAGIDSEWVRHICQNILIHDKWYFPGEKAGYELKHYPMLMPDGNPFLLKTALLPSKIKSSCPKTRFTVIIGIL